jgi:hypothetical protein
MDNPALPGGDGGAHPRVLRHLEVGVNVAIVERAGGGNFGLGNATRKSGWPSCFRRRAAARW